MIKQQLYGKTQRFSQTEKTIITEKIDGSNLVFFKKDSVLHIAERSTIYTLDEADKLSYKGLKGWVTEHGKALEEALVENAAIIGEWIGTGRLKYNFDHRFLMFAKANVYDELELTNKLYIPELFKYPFKNQETPSFIGQVPVLGEYFKLMSLEDLNAIYEIYVLEVGRSVEGFIVNTSGNISKYVRNKNGYIEDHVTSYARQAK